MSIRFPGLVRIFLIGVTAAIISSSAVAQDAAPQATSDEAPNAAEQNAPKEVIFGGISYFAPNAAINNIAFHSGIGYVFSSTTYFNRYFGLQMESGSTFADNVNIGTIQGGISLRLPSPDFTPFAHTTLGANNISPAGINGRYGIGITAGGGVDMRVYKALSWRIFQADVLYTHVNFVGDGGPRLNPVSARIATGVVFTLGRVK